jgi:hypothetical protein
VISHREDARFVLDYPALVPCFPLIAMPGKHDRHAPEFVIGIIRNP